MANSFHRFIVYGPQAPTAFVTGGYNAQIQGKWIGDCLSYCRDHNLSKIEPTAQAEKDWIKHTNDAGKEGLFSETESWYFGSNIPVGQGLNVETASNNHLGCTLT